MYCGLDMTNIDELNNEDHERTEESSHRLMCKCICAFARPIPVPPEQIDELKNCVKLAGQFVSGLDGDATPESRQIFGTVWGMVNIRTQRFFDEIESRHTELAYFEILADPSLIFRQNSIRQRRCLSLYSLTCSLLRDMTAYYIDKNGENVYYIHRTSLRPPREPPRLADWKVFVKLPTG